MIFFSNVSLSRLKGRLLLISTSLLMMSACGQKKAEVVERYDVLSEFQEYIDEYERVASEEGRPTTITNLVATYGATPSLNHTAICEVTEGQPPKIIVNQTVWNTLSVHGRKVVLFHELGHCNLRRVHKNSLISGTSVPESLMYMYRVGDNTYLSNQEHYHQELFSTSNEF